MNIRKKANPNNIVFHEKGHIYVNPDGDILKSVTTVLKDYQIPFPDDAVIKYSKKHNRTIKDVQAEWDYKRNLGTEIGSWLHLQIESQLLGKVPDLDYLITNNGTKEQYEEKLQYLENYKIQIAKYLEWQSQFTHIGNEIIVGNKKNAGQIDELNLQCINDYKNDKEINFEKSWINWKGEKVHKKMLPPFQDLDDCNWNKYCLQINFYHYLLPEEIKSKFTQPHKIIKFNRYSEDFKVYEVPNWQDKIKQITNDIE